MRLKFEFETGGRQRRPRVHASDTDAAWDRIVAEHLKSATAPPEKYDAARKWVGGAVTVYALMNGRDPATVLGELERAHPAPQLAAPTPTGQEPPLALPDAMALLKPGRSTPPPPKSPGAQKAVAVDAQAAPAD